MSDKSMTLQSQTADMLLSYDSDAVVEMAKRLMRQVRLSSANRNLSDVEAAELAVYALMTDLNPFNNECYYMEKIGPIPGIAGYRRKAEEYIEARWGSQEFYNIEYVPADETEANFDPKADVAWKAVLRDSVSQRNWRDMMMRAYIEMIKAGVPEETAWKRAEMLAGPEPIWWAVGVVSGDEHFSGQKWENNKPVPGEYKPEMWDRNERAKKRAAKGAIRQRFPTTIIPRDRLFGDTIDGDWSDVTDRAIRRLQSETPAPPRDEATIKKELGFETEEPTIDPTSGQEIPPANDGSEPLPTEEEIYDAVVEAGLAENVYQAKGSLAKCRTGYHTIPMAIAWMRNYRGMRDEGLSSDEAAELANRGVKPGGKNGEQGTLEL